MGKATVADTDLERACREMIATCACEGLRRTSRAVSSRYQAALAPTGVRVAQLPILVAAALMGRAPITAMAEILVIDRTTLTRNVAGLEGDGFVTIEDDDDRRLRLVVLTDKGREALRDGLAAWRDVQRRVAERFGPERLQALVSELAAFTEALQQ